MQAQSTALVKTRHPGIYRRGERYVVAYRVGGRQKRETVGTLKEALRVKRAREADRDRGEYQEASRVPFRDYAAEWIVRYQGSGRGGFRESTRADYRRDLERYAFPYFADRLGRTVSAIQPRDVANWVAWLCEQRHGRGKKRKPLSDRSIRRIVAPLRVCLATARAEGLIRNNPATGIKLPHREQIDDREETQARPFSREQLDAVLRVVRAEHRALFQLLAATGLRWSEAIALRRRDLVLSGSRPRVRVRRAYVRGTFGPPKSRYGRRDVPLPVVLVRALRAHLGPEGDADELAFRGVKGGPLDYSWTRREVLRPAVEEAGAPWAGFHSCRHTFASLHLARGTTLVQLQRLLGHHSPDFTLRTYAHLIPGDEADALDLEAELEGADADNKVVTDPTGTEPTTPETDLAKATI